MRRFVLPRGESSQGAFAVGVEGVGGGGTVHVRVVVGVVEWRRFGRSRRYGGHLQRRHELGGLTRHAKRGRRGLVQNFKSVLAIGGSEQFSRVYAMYRGRIARSGT
jgi:hypothetical protein